MLTLKKQKEMVANFECVKLQSSSRLAVVRREWHARKRNGRDVCYIVISRDNTWALLSQKISLLSQMINTNLTPNEAWAKVSTNGLFENIDCTGGRGGGWHKGNWRISSVDLDDACDAFDKVRGRCANALVVSSQPDCYECEPL